MTVSELREALSSMDQTLRVAVGGRDGMHWASIAEPVLCHFVGETPYEEYYPELHDADEDGPLETIVKIV